jgi:membrane-bound lytic murein transglycosylase D
MHTVRHGDTLWDIARQYGVSVQHLREWNALDQERVLALGEHLRVQPIAGPVAAVTMTAPPEEMIEYRVKSGDSLWRIARRHDVRVADLRRWNRLPTDGKLQPGQALRIHMPGQASDVRI